MKIESRGLLVLGFLLLVAAWYSPPSPRVPPPPKWAKGEVPRCPLPPRVERGQPPLQTAVPEGMEPFRLDFATLEPLAGFSLDAVVLSRENYLYDEAAKLSPVDYLLGWARLTDKRISSRFSFSQSRRYGSWFWKGSPPIPKAELDRSIANMHMIPSDKTIARRLRRVKKGDRVQIDGWLIQATRPDGWHWRSSLTREDSGPGACEIVYVCSIERD